MSVSGPMMTLNDRQKCFEERKQLATHPCAAHHYVTLGVEIDTGMLLTPDSSPSALSSNSYQNSLHQSTESLVPPPPPVTRCSVLNMPTTPPRPEQEQSSFMQQTAYTQVGSPHNSIGSPQQVQMGSPYSAVSSPDSQMFSPQNQAGSPFDQIPTSHSHMVLPQHQIGSPQYVSNSPPHYQTNVRSPSQFSGHSSEHLSTPPPQYTIQYPHTMEDVDGLPHLISFSNATSCVGMPVFGAEHVIYSMPSQQMTVLESHSMGPHHQLPPFANAFENPMSESQLPDKHTAPEAFCGLPDTVALPIKQIPNDFGLAPIEFYHPPTPPTPEGHPNLMCHPEMCVPPPPDMCGPLPPLPSHLCPIPTLASSGRRRPKQVKRVPQIEVDDSDIKDIPTSSQLWEFTLRVLKKPKYKYMVSWEKREEGLFRFNNAQAFAALWGKHRNRPQMSYDKVARALRYYYKRNILEQVGGRLTYRFTKRLSKMYLSDV